MMSSISICECLLKRNKKQPIFFFFFRWLTGDVKRLVYNNVTRKKVGGNMKLTPKSQSAPEEHDAVHLVE